MEFASLLRNKLSEALGNPYIVKEVQSAEYSRFLPIDQCHPLYLYKHTHLDCVIVHPTRKEIMIRAFRLPKSDLSLAKAVFRGLSSHIPDFYRNFTDWYTANKLTNLSELIRKHESWSSVHIAVQAGLKEVLTIEQVGPIINNRFCDEGRSPMHLACDLNHLDILEKCVLVGGDLSLQDENGDTVLHYAVRKKSKQLVDFVSENMSKNDLNIKNTSGETALHVAIEMKKINFAKMLIEKGCSLETCSKIGYPIHYALKFTDSQFTSYLLSKSSDQVALVCAKHKSLPIHWCRSAEDVRLLIENGSQIVYSSQTCDTPLHIMVIKDRLDAAIGMIFQHADVNVKGKNGYTPLHLAVQNDNYMLVKMLLLFGADCQAKNDHEETPGLLAIRNAKPNKEKIMELLSAVGGIILGDKNRKMGKVAESGKTTIHTNNHHSALENSKGKVLCLDGGGIRGLILTQILLAIEEETGKKCKDLFDWICGTSTGGILALCLCQGMRAVDCQSIYFRLKDRVFTGSRPYDSTPIEKFLKEIFGENATLEQMERQTKVIITSVLADQCPAKLHLFRNYESLRQRLPKKRKAGQPIQRADSLTVEEIQQNPMATPIWQVARSSGAAPTYFRPMGQFLDGGLMSNNPTVDALTEITRYNKALRQSGRSSEIKQPGVLISVGTGRIPATKVKSVDVILPSVPNPFILVNSAIAGLDLTQVMIEAATETNGHVNDRGAAWCDSIDAAYYRLQPQLKEDVLLNEVRDEKLIDMLWSTKLYIQENKHLIQEIAHILTKDIT